MSSELIRVPKELAQYLRVEQANIKRLTGVKLTLPKVVVICIKNGKIVIK